ncbi:hypothetical protein WA556_002503, partial [Blastocystis sp. ATCC 50177/Nand II]
MEELLAELDKLPAESTEPVEMLPELDETLEQESLDAKKAIRDKVEKIETEIESISVNVASEFMKVTLLPVDHDYRTRAEEQFLLIEADCALLLEDRKRLSEQITALKELNSSPFVNDMIGYIERKIQKLEASLGDYYEQAVDCERMVNMQTQIQTAKKDIASTVNELMETTADEDKTVDLSLLDGHEANPFVEKTESDMMREIDAMLEKL